MGEYIGEGRGDIKDDDNDIYYADLEDEHQQNLGGGSDEAGDSCRIICSHIKGISHLY